MYLQIIGWVIIPIILLFLPVDFFDSGQSLCLSQVLLDKECMGCGITRGVHHAIHFDFYNAWQYNKLTFIVLPLLCIYWIYILIQLIKKRK